jgi:hypothetical protein
MILREREPLNFETPFGSLDGFITSADRLFARSRFLIPRIGAAWTSEVQFTKVEIGADGGETWHGTRRRGEPVRDASRLWDYDRKAATKPGKAMLMARATDSEGRTQPAGRDRGRRGHMVNHLLPIEVEVR